MDSEERPPDPHSDQEARTQAELVSMYEAKLSMQREELQAMNDELQTANEELHLALRRYRRLYDSAPVGYLTLDANGTILEANLPAASLLAVARSHLPGMALAEFVVAEDQDRYFLEVRRHLRDESRHHRSELRLTDATGEVFWAGLEFSVIANEDGEGSRVWCILSDVTERRTAVDALEASRNKLRMLAVRVEELREEERRMLARDLHDGVGQSLAVLGMDLASLKGELEGEQKAAKDRISEMRSDIEGIIKQVSDQLFILRPPELDALGLQFAIERKVESIAKRSGLRCILDLPVGDRRFGDQVETQLLRIFEEALSNVLRHAGATSLRVALSEEGDVLTLVVEDDGSGISNEDMHGLSSLGLMGMQERAELLGGSLTISQGSLGGTCVQATIPLPA